jgi:hypothetical protein
MSYILSDFLALFKMKKQKGKPVSFLLGMDHFL